MAISHIQTTSIFILWYYTPQSPEKKKKVTDNMQVNTSWLCVTTSDSERIRWRYCSSQTSVSHPVQQTLSQSWDSSTASFLQHQQKEKLGKETWQDILISHYRIYPTEFSLFSAMWQRCGIGVRGTQAGALYTRGKAENLPKPLYLRGGTGSSQVQGGQRKEQGERTPLPHRTSEAPLPALQ